MQVELTLQNYTRADGSTGNYLVIKTPKGVEMEISHTFHNSKLEYKIKCEVLGITKENK